MRSTPLAHTATVVTYLLIQFVLATRLLGYRCDLVLHNPQIFPVDPKPAQCPTPLHSAPVSSAPTSWATRGEEYSMTKPTA